VKRCYDVCSAMHIYSSMYDVSMCHCTLGWHLMKFALHEAHQLPYVVCVSDSEGVNEMTGVNVPQAGR